MLLKSNSLLILCVLPFLLALQFSAFSQSGKDGSEIITSTNVIFNRYDNLNTTANPGATTITINNIANLSASAIAGSANNPYATNALSAGDLLMIIKMQGASVNTSSTTSSAYGNITDYNNTGVYELTMVQSISGNTITLYSALVNTYTISATQRVQVVRIPRLSSLTVNSGASLTGQAWGSSYTGGIVAVEVNGNAAINGTITANGIGFRGGEIHGSTQNLGVTTYASASTNDGAIKGEGIAGYKTDLGTTYYGRGAPANGGGGGTQHNAGGGGGSNAGTGTWTGQGNPGLSGSNWNVAWDLESGSFSTSTSSGGGRGGYTYSLRNKDAMLPNSGSNQWQGDDRRNMGGLGGRPLTYSTNTLFLGGGGGAGDQNNNSGTAGGNGGGIIYLHVSGSLSGTGLITANANAASNTVLGDNLTGNSTYNDAPGGGGGGGAIKLNVQISITGITVQANGGKGGDQTGPATADEAYGPGGGGGGGYIGVVGNPAITKTVNGGANGITTSGGLSEFIPNGATRGAAGTIATGLSYSSSPDFVLPVTLKCFSLTPISNNRLQIDWTVYDEANIVGYDLEQDAGDGVWKSIFMKPAQSVNSSIKQYSMIISAPAQNVYLRLKAKDVYGTYKYSCTKAFKPSVLAGIAIVQNAQLIEIRHPNKIYTFKLYNNAGQEVKNVVTNESSVSTTINKALLTKGIYYLEISIAGERIVFDVIK
jgi:hypothetical protein